MDVDLLPITLVPAHGGRNDHQGVFSDEIPDASLPMASGLSGDVELES